MKYYRLLKLHILLVFLFSTAKVFAQKKQMPPVLRDTTLGVFEGALQYSTTFLADSVLVLNGNLSFNSKLLYLPSESIPAFMQLTVKGKMNLGLKHDSWTLYLNRYLLENPSILQGQTLRFNHQLGGKEYSHFQKFSNGKRHGQWKIFSKPILDGRPAREQQKGSVQFVNDTVFGRFFLKGMTTFGKDVFVRGLVNKDGFLDSTITLQYVDEGISLKESRIYDDGFLLEIEILNLDEDTIVSKISFLDVKHALIDLELDSNDLKIVKDDKRYGILFDNNYLTDDLRLSAQIKGNTVLQSVIDELLFGDDFMQENISPPVGFHTRRFRFSYNPTEQLLIDSVLLLNETLQYKIKSILERPKFLLRKSTSLDLTRIQHILSHYKEKVEIVQKEFDLIQSDYFNFYDRHAYYSDGINGLNRPDTISFVFQGKQYSENFEPPVFADQPSLIVSRTFEILKFISGQINLVDKAILESLTLFDQQDKIDELEDQIAKSAKALESAYDEIIFHQNKPSSELPFAYKMYQSVNERLIEPVRQKYLGNGLSVDEAIVLGNNMICLMDFLSDNKHQFDRLESLAKIWNDSIFTVYQDNPFDYRPFETKVLGGVQSAVNILLKYQANNMLYSKSCESLREEMAGIVKLEKRVIYLRQNYLSENVKLLDRSLRRERVPQRITRILEL
jgi:hypothetical protein